MCSDGDYDAYGDRSRLWHVYSADIDTEKALMPTATLMRLQGLKSPLSRRKRLYRRLGQMFLRWAETDGGKW